MFVYNEFYELNECSLRTKPLRADKFNEWLHPKGWVSSKTVLI